MEDCLFCKIGSGAIPVNAIYGDEHILAFPDKFPKADVHILVIPKIHVTNLFALQETHKEVMWHLLSKLPPLAKKLGLADGFRTVTNTGAGGGQSIFHLHFHLLGGKHLPAL